MKTKVIALLVFAWLGCIHVYAAGPTVVVTRPNASDRWHPITSVRIQWQATGFEGNLDWSLTLLTNNVQFQRIYDTPVHEGGGQWHVDTPVPPHGWPGGCNYTLSVNEDGIIEVRGESAVFCVVEPSVVVLRPKSTDHWQPGSSYRIVWQITDFQGPLDWSFHLFTNQVLFPNNPPLAQPPVDEGGGIWHADVMVPNDWPSGCAYALKINEDGYEAHGASAAFCVGVPVLTIRDSPMKICWSTRSNRTYQVQYSSTLAANGWTNLGVAVPGNGTTNCVTDAVAAGGGQKYYRVQELP